MIIPSEFSISCHELLISLNFEQQAVKATAGLGTSVCRNHICFLSSCCLRNIDLKKPSLTQHYELHLLITVHLSLT